MASSDSSLRPLGDHNGANSEESPMKACFERVDFLAKTLMAAFGIIVVEALGGYKDIIKKPLNSLTRAAALFSILTLFSGFVLNLYVNNTSSHINLTSWQYMFHVMLVSFGGICLMGTNVLILTLVHWVNALLACFLVVMLFVIGILAYAGSRINSTNRLPRDKAFQAAMKSCSDVAHLTVGSAFTMHLGVVFMYYNNPSLRINQLPPVDISVTFLVLVLGVFSMMVTAMPLELLPLAVTSKLLYLVKFLIYSMLFLTATAALILGGKFLDGMISLALMPILVVIVAYQAMLLLTGRRVNPDPNNVGNEDPENPERVYPDPNNVGSENPENPERVNPDPNNVGNEDPENPERVNPGPNNVGNEIPENPERVNADPNNVGSENPENLERVNPDPNNVNGELEMPSMLTGVINSCIVLLSAVYALYTGGENGDVYVRVGIFVLVGTIAACLSWITLLVNPSMNEQRANVRKLVIGILVGLMMTIAAAFLLKICVDLFYQTK